MATCRNHPSVETVQLCEWCREAFCGDCLVEVLDRHVCAGCRDLALRALEQRTLGLGQKCRRCGEMSPPGMSYCSRCGAALLASDAPPRPRFSLFNHLLAITAAAGAAFALAYRGVEWSGYMQTAAAFIGLPMLIGVLTAYLSRPRTGLGTTLKVTTILLCVVAPLLGEGVVCLLMAAPIFYVVAIAGYYMVAGLTNLFGPRGRRGGLFVVILPFLAARLTATPHGIHHPRVMTVADEVVIAASPTAVSEILRKGDLVSRDFPLFLRLGFPLPKSMERRPDGRVLITFDPGSERWPGTNVIVSRQTTDATGSAVIFVIENDSTKLARWLTFQESRFQVEPCSGGCRVRQATRFRQRLQPGLYWNPLQSFAVSQMHRYELEHLKRVGGGAAVSAAEAWFRAHDPLLRTALFFSCAAYFGVAFALLRPRGRELPAAIMAVWVQFSLGTLLDILLVRVGVWRYRALSLSAGGVPLDLHLDWTLVWAFALVWLHGRLPARCQRLAGSVAYLLAWTVLTIAVDLLLAPRLPFLAFASRRWWLWDAALLFVLQAITLLTFRSIVAPPRGEPARAVACCIRSVGYVATIACLVYGYLPAVILSRTHGWGARAVSVLGEWGALAAMLALPMGLGTWAMLEFAVRGLGTPLPLDPPEQLVTRGPYAYVRNPMQIAALLMSAALPLRFPTPYMLMYVVDIALLSAAIFYLIEEGSLSTAFGAEYADYRRQVRVWLPRLRPYRSPAARVTEAVRDGAAAQPEPAPGF